MRDVYPVKYYKDPTLSRLESQHFELSQIQTTIC